MPIIINKEATVYFIMAGAIYLLRKAPAKTDIAVIRA